MAKYLLNPIYAYREIKENFILYVKTAFHTKYKGLESERDELLRKDGVVSREPWIEPLPAYSNVEREYGKLRISSLTANDLPGMDDKSIELFKQFILKGLIKGNYPIYEHQAEMLRKSLEGNNCVITSGTGSGKTESFLLPMFADIIKEAVEWPARTSAYPINDWWNGGNGKAKTAKDIFTFESGAQQNAPGKLASCAMQRPNEERDSAVRAIVIYPMNALVEDQMTRLRDALDNDEVQEWMEKNLKGNRIFFGRYNGSTPTSGYPKYRNGKTNAKICDSLKKAMCYLDKMTYDTLALINNTEGLSKEQIENNRKKYGTRRTISQMLKGKDGFVSAEMRTRFDMQQTPPDILITNYSMLAMMLMREVDNPIIEKTRAWLQKSPSHIFHLIIDELHLNRGTSGTETAYLIRLLLNRLGLTPNSKQLRILSSSASLEVNGSKREESLKFLKDFFGCEFNLDNIIEGHYVESNQQYDTLLPIEPFTKIYDLFNTDTTCFENYQKSESVREKVDKVCSASASILANYCKYNLEDENGLTQLLKVFSSNNLAILKRLSDTFNLGELGHNRALPFNKGIGESESANELGRYFSTSLFGDVEKSAQAAEGLIIIRGLFDIFKNVSCGPIQRFRFHMFFRNIDGLWATLDKYDKNNEKPVGKLHAHSADIDGDKRVLELMYCEQCGTIFYGGKRHAYKNDEGQWVTDILPTSSNLEDLPEKQSQVMVEKRNYREFAVFYPIPDDFNESFIEGVNRNSELNKHKISFTKGKNVKRMDCSWELAYLDEKTGRVSMSFEGEQQQGIKGYLYTVRDLDGESNIDAASKAPALPCHCPNCMTNRLNSRVYRSPLRGFRTGFNKVTQLYARELFYQLPTSNKRKLVTFADSRQDAAVVANSIERNQYSDLMRDVIVEQCILKSNEDLSIIKNEIQQYLKNLDEIKDFLNQPNVPDIVKNQILNNDIPQIEAKIASKKELLSRTMPISDLLDKDNCLSSPIYRELKKLYTNPAGCDSAKQHYEETSDADSILWYDIPDSPSDRLKKNINEKAGASIQQHLMGLLFGRLHYNIESSGIGWVTIQRDDNKIKDILSHINVSGNICDLSGLITCDLFMQVVDTVIRLTGNEYRYVGNPFDVEQHQSDEMFENLTVHSAVRRYINAFCNLHNLPIIKIKGKLKVPNPLGQAVLDYLKEKGNGMRFLKSHTLQIHFVTDNDNAYVCPRCGRIHLHKSGEICSGCFSHLTESDIVSVAEIRRNTDLMINMVKGRKACRIHSEELTGQTDNQSERQLQFRDIVRVDSNRKNADYLEKVKSIDVLSVTTTMEVGVDIGPLQGVMLTNMPPQRFNYQQRVGRGGRRGQAYSTILTLCRGRSHDEHYFMNPYQITGDQPPTPFLSMDQKEILKRMFAKEILYYAFKSYAISKNIRMEGNTHGEFGTTEDWVNNVGNIREYIHGWLSSNENKGLLKRIANVLTENEECIKDLISYADLSDDNNLFTDINKVVSDESIVADSLAECLAEGGILPMYGMPTRDRMLYHSFIFNDDNRVEEELASVSRPIDQAITAFAPGSSITKDKHVFTSIGFAQPSLKYNSILRNIDSIAGKDSPVFPLKLTLWKCTNPSCNCILTESFTNETSRKCKYCDSEMEKCTICTPSAFITALSKGFDQKDDNEIIVKRNGIQLENSPVSSTQIQTPEQNVCLSLRNGGLTWRISDNEIEGQECNVSYSLNNSTIYSKSKQWIASPIYNGIDEPKTLDSNVRLVTNDSKDVITYINPIVGVQKENIHLAARKITNVLTLSPRNKVDGLILEPFHCIEENGKMHLDFATQGVRAAYYSLSFILQRAIASKLDVDPTEIDVVEVLSKPGGLGEICLADEKINGSGFVADFYNNFNLYIKRILNGDDVYFKQMLSDEHATECKSSCYKCLSSYRNMPYHGLLDWRLGIALLRVMADSSYKAGSDGNFDYIELKGWHNFAKQLLKSLNEGFYRIDDNRFLYKLYETSNGIPYLYSTQGNLKPIFASHPLWDSAERTAVLADALLEASMIHNQDWDSNNVIKIDTFNMLRRMSNCYEYIENIQNRRNENN